jgi:glycerol 3-phosphatase-1
MHLEALMPKLYGSDAVEIPGARSLCAALSAPSPTAAPWAIVTSGTTPLVSGWMTILSLPQPGHVVAAEMVEHGKPSPEGYLKGAEKLGLAPEGLLVLEDSPAGIKAGKAAGCRVLAVTTTHTAEQVVAAGADWVVKDLQSVKIVRMDGGKAVLQIENIWKSESITGSML